MNAETQGATTPQEPNARSLALLPLYQSHKIVAAALILSMTVGHPLTNIVLQLPDGKTTSQLVTSDYMEKHMPEVGGYYVRYADGYESWSPADAFEEGYSLLEPVQPGTVGGPRIDFIEQIARVCHEVNRAYCEALGDLSQHPWPAAPQWQKDSAVLGVKLHLEHPDAGAKASHESWMAQKVADGWVRGDVKDAEAKTHPCLVPFHELPVAQQAKDYIFRGVVHALATPTAA